MGNQYVSLSFEFKKYADEETVAQTIRFEGHKGWQNIQFSLLPPNEQQVRLLAELARILEEFARVE